MSAAAEEVRDDWARPMPGSLRLSIGSLQVHIHWTALLGGLCFTGAAAWDPHIVPWLVLGYFAVVLLHEAGHAIAARVLGLTVHFVQLAGIGGRCVMDPPRRARDAAIVYSAGLLAQAILFAGTAIGVHLHEGPSGEVAGGLAFAFLAVNTLLFLLSVVPWKAGSGIESDGRVLWRLARDRWQGRTFVGPSLSGIKPLATAPVFAPETSLLSIPSLVPTSFQQGLEVFNDTRTPFEFVMNVFVRHLGWSAQEAAAKAVDIHNQGGAIIPSLSLAEAERIATLMSKDAAAAGHPFLCRAVDRNAAAATV